MTFARLALRSLVHYRRTHIPVAIGVATSVAVLAGALLVGHSVRASLNALAAGRLGHAEVVVSSELPFGEALAARLGADPLFVLPGLVQTQPSGRRSGHVVVYGIDDRFFAFHGVQATAPTGSDLSLIHI